MFFFFHFFSTTVYSTGEELDDEEKMVINGAEVLSGDRISNGSLNSKNFVN